MNRVNLTRAPDRPETTYDRPPQPGASGSVAPRVDGAVGPVVGAAAGAYVYEDVALAPAAPPEAGEQAGRPADD